jgi:cardiolipin synthase A/B
MLGPYEFECNYSVHDEEFVTSVGFLLGPALLPGNNFQLMTNDNDKSVFNLITTAKRSICIDTSCNWNTPQGLEISELLAEKAESGVPVHLVLPNTSNRQSFSTDQLVRFTAADVEVFSMQSRFSFSGQKKSADFTFITVDGAATAMISSDWQFGLILKGPVVGQIQAAFNEFWMQVQEQVTHGEFYFSDTLQTAQSPITPAANSNPTSARAQYFDGTNLKTPHKLHLSALYSIGVAKESLIISSAFSKWLPQFEKELKKAEQRGVRIEKINSQHNFLIVDETWSSIALRKNAVLNTHDGAFAREIQTLIRFNKL